MKRITLRADEGLVEEARPVAKSQHTTLSAAFREWLKLFASQPGNLKDLDGDMQRLRHIKSGRRLNRDEMNQR